MHNVINKPSQNKWILWTAQDRYNTTNSDGPVYEEGLDAWTVFISHTHERLPRHASQTLPHPSASILSVLSHVIPTWWKGFMKGETRQRMEIIKTCGHALFFFSSTFLGLIFGAKKKKKKKNRGNGKKEGRRAMEIMMPYSPVSSKRRTVDGRRAMPLPTHHHYHHGPSSNLIKEKNNNN